jgi:4a-hydroxytetrahydrobiopterin dehydratase
MSNLTQRKCVRVQANDPPLVDREIAALKLEIPDWFLVDRAGMPNLERVFKFKDFSQALAFTDRVGALAEAEDHHPALLTEWGRVTVSLWTHRINGLHHNDFIVAAKTDELYRNFALTASI